MTRRPTWSPAARAGTGHGFSRRDEIDVATARLVVSAAVAAATFFIEAYAAQRQVED